MLFLIPFAICAAAALTQMVLLDQIRVALSLRHPAKFAELLLQAWPNRLQPMALAISRFVRKREDKFLHDVRLTALSRISYFLTWVYMLAWLVAVVAVFKTMRS